MRAAILLIPGPAPPDNDSVTQTANDARHRTDTVRSLRHVPALDGLRGVAIALVLAGHAGGLRGGGLGVDLFFALSGFLITSLLVGEWATRGRVDRRAFYVRRARRLIPALAGVLIWFTLLGLISGNPQVLLQVVIGATYVSNVVQAVTPQPELFSHLWSLAEEEQFYVLWPLALIWLLRRRVRPPRIVIGLVLVAGVSIVESAALAADGSSLRRLWFAPDTHAASIVLGCAAGMAWAWQVWRVPAFVGYAGALTLAVVVGVFSLDDRALYLGPLALFSAASAATVIAIVENPTSRLARALGHRVLRWLGKISYGLYLWHLPLFVLAGPLVGSALAIGAAVLSYRYVEQPLLRGRRRPSVRDRGQFVLPAPVGEAPGAGST